MMNGKRAGQRDRGEHLPAARAEIVTDVQVDLRDLQHARDRVDHDRIEHADRDHHDLRRLAQAEDQQDQRQNRALRNRIGAEDQRFDQRAHRAIQTHRQTDDQRRNRAEQEAPEEPLEADQRVGFELTVGDQRAEGAGDARRRREETRVDQRARRPALPTARTRRAARRCSSGARMLPRESTRLRVSRPANDDGVGALDFSRRDHRNASTASAASPALAASTSSRSCPQMS